MHDSATIFSVEAAGQVYKQAHDVFVRVGSRLHDIGVFDIQTDQWMISAQDNEIKWHRTVKHGTTFFMTHGHGRERQGCRYLAGD